jgi:hypothetical protein
MILKGNDALEKANKMMESLNVSQKVDSFSNVEKTFSAYNGKRYGIVKEGTKYIIKEAVVKNAKNSNDFAYIDGVQNKSKYSKNTLLEAEKTLNLWNIEFSRVYGTSLMKEEEEMPEDEESPKKTVLKVPMQKSAAPMPAMPAGDAGMGADMPPMPAEGGDMPPMPAEGGDMPPMPDAEGAEGMGEEDEESGVDPKKSIQKLAGKLAYELREFEGEDDDYSDIYKFAASMVASAADASKITAKDRKSIINKVEKNLTPDEEDEISSDEEEMPEDEMPEGGEEGEEMPPMPAGEEESEEGIDKTLAEAFKRIQEAKRKYSKKQLDALDKDGDKKLTKKDFEMLHQKESIEMPMNEGLKGKPINAWIKDFVNSKNPKFEGKSKKQRREMAIAAFLKNEKSQGKDSSVTLMKGKKSKKGKKSLKEGSGYSMSMDEDYMISEKDDFYFDEGKKKDELLLGGQYMDESYLDEDYMSEEDKYMMEYSDLDEDYMSEEDKYMMEYSDLDGDEPMLEITDLDEDVYFEMDYSQKKK